MERPPEPLPLRQCPIDLQKSLEGDKGARARVVKQNSRIRKREREIQEWRLLYGVNADTDYVASFDNNDNHVNNDNHDNHDHNDHDERYV